MSALAFPIITNYNTVHIKIISNCNDEDKGIQKTVYREGRHG